MSSEEASRNEQPSESDETEQLPPPYIGRLGTLTGDIILFMMYTASLNYDAFFFSPALMALAEREFVGNGFLNFFAEDFNLREHARGFQFSETETREQFAKRFFRYIADAENVPSNTRELAAKFAISFKTRYLVDYFRGYIRPCPLYSFVRALTMLENERKLREMDINSVEVIIKFLLTEFDAKDYGIDDNVNVTDISIYVWHGFGMNSDPVVLTDGSVASQLNKELFQRLQVEEAVPQNVKDALAAILPHM